MKTEHKTTHKTDHKHETHKKEEKADNKKVDTSEMSEETKRQQPPLTPPAPNPPIPNTQPNVVVQTQLTQIRQKYPQLTNDDLMGTRDQIAARVSAKLNIPYNDVINLIPEQA